VSIDGVAYEFLGDASANIQMQSASQTSVNYTSTRSIFSMNVGPAVTLEIEFLSPVAPTDLKRMSLVSSYMNVKVISKDGKAHQVVVYSDVSAGMQSSVSLRFYHATI